MENAEYARLRDLSRQVAAALPEPLFYRQHPGELSRAEEALRSNPLIQQCRSYLDESRLECAHGLCHCEAVARDAGTLVLIEAPKREIPDRERGPLFRAALIAGLLHDIRRQDKDHAVLGSIEADRILAHLGMDGRERQYVSVAIRNHEAFKEPHDSGESFGRLVSDVLYDADKFRWGPENFTTTLWLIVEARETPLETLHQRFRASMEGIEKIKGTFRTETGRTYGPEFISQGIDIGKAIYEEMSRMLSR